MIKLDYMQSWNQAMALLIMHKEAVLAIAGVFIFLPNLLMAHFIGQPVFRGDENMAEILAIYRMFLEDNALPLISSNLVSTLGMLAICFALAPSRNLTVGESLVAALKVFFIYFIASLAMGLLGSLGFLALIVPGLYIFSRLSLMSIIVADTNQRQPLGLLKDSWELTKGNGFSILVFVLITLIVGSIAFSIILTVVGALTGIATGGNGWPLLEHLVAALGETILAVILNAIIVSIYMTLSRREEGLAERFS